MMNRRDWFRNAALLAAGVIAADQLELLDRLAPRSLFGAWGNTNIPPKLWGDGIHDDTTALQWRLDRAQSIHGGAFRTTKPLIARQNMLMTNCYIESSARPVLLIPSVVTAGHFTYNRIDARSAPPGAAIEYEPTPDHDLVFHGRA